MLPYSGSTNSSPAAAAAGAAVALGGVASLVVVVASNAAALSGITLFVVGKMPSSRVSPRSCLWPRRQGRVVVGGGGRDGVTGRMVGPVVGGSSSSSRGRRVGVVDR